MFIIGMKRFVFLLGVGMMRGGVFYGNEGGECVGKILFGIGVWVGVGVNGVVLVGKDVVEFVVG